MNTNLLFIEVLGLIFLLQYQQAESVSNLDDLEGVVTLTADNFDKTLAKNNLLVLFYGPGCLQCDELAGTWKNLADYFNKNGKLNNRDRKHMNKASTISIAKANCSNEKALCTEKCSWNETM